MKNIEKWQNKSYLIMGLGKSGWGLIDFLHQLDVHLVVFDDHATLNDQGKQKLEKYGVTALYQDIKEMDELQVDILVKSPGIPYNHALIQWAIEKNIPILTDVELISDVTEAEIIAVTGSNGKSTTTQLIGDLLNLNRSSGRAIVAGNIGVSVSEVLPQAQVDDDAVIELSSFQLLGTDNFRPHIAVITNIYSAHLDYHGSREDYVQAKMRITANQEADDYLIYNADQEELETLVKDSKACLIPFSLTARNKNGFYVADQAIYYQDEKWVELGVIRMPGSHNVENVMAALAVARLKGVDRHLVSQYLSVFAGIPHRLQYVGTWNSYSFYNDSKATNAKATKKALSAFKSPLVLIAGGLDRGEDFDDLLPDFKEKVRAIVLLGESRERLAATAEAAGVDLIVCVETMDQAVAEAISLAHAEDTVLLSPASASWDQYASFEERGDDFIQCIENYFKKEGKQ